MPESWKEGPEGSDGVQGLRAEIRGMRTELNARVDRLDGKIDRVAAEQRGEIRDVRIELSNKIDGVAAETRRLILGSFATLLVTIVAGLLAQSLL